jgi:hypothetical protein
MFTFTDRARLWAKLTAYNPFYGQYAQITDRRIPVVILRAVGSAKG